MKKGDAFAIIATPIGRALDYFFGTHFEGCEGCRRRRAMLNEQTFWQLLKRLWYRLTHR